MQTICIKVIQIIIDFKHWKFKVFTSVLLGLMKANIFLLSCKSVKMTIQLLVSIDGLFKVIIFFIFESIVRNVYLSDIYKVELNIFDIQSIIFYYTIL